jgi:NAD(P)-dependent dehydrogenase (short-subunit alcohol dehydrogenase family)
MMKNKPVIIITGGSGFLGSAISAEMLSIGWHVVSLSQSLSSNKDVESYICDITKEAEVNEIAKKILVKHLEISAIIHTSARALVRKPVLETTIEFFLKDVETSIFGALSLIQNFLPHMKNGSAIIGITTEAIESDSNAKNLGSYIPTKHALRGLLQALSREVPNMRIYAVAPGFLAGGLNRDLPKTVLDFMSQKNRSELGKAVKIISTMCANKDAYKSGTSTSVSSEKTSPL